MSIVPLIADHADIVTLEWAGSHGARILVVLAAAVMVSFLARAAVRRMRRKVEGVDSITQELALQRAATLTNSLSSALKLLIWTVAVLLVLSEVGLNVAPLLAGAGIAGVALGFGAQSLVRDFLSGFFILLEDQFGVGHVVDVMTSAGPVSGRVEALTLRTTTIRAFDGTLHVVPNGNIQYIGNRSRGWARAIVDARIAYGQDLDRVREVLEEVFDDIRRDENLSRVIFSGPNVLGIETLDTYQVVVRVVAETRPSRRPEVERELRQRITQRFDQRDIRVPAMPPLVPAPGAGL